MFSKALFCLFGGCWFLAFPNLPFRVRDCSTVSVIRRTRQEEYIKRTSYFLRCTTTSLRGGELGSWCPEQGRWEQGVVLLAKPKLWRDLKGSGVVMSRYREEDKAKKKNHHPKKVSVT